MATRSATVRQARSASSQFMCLASVGHAGVQAECLGDVDNSLSHRYRRQPGWPGAARPRTARRRARPARGMIGWLASPRRTPGQAADCTMATVQPAGLALSSSPRINRRLAQTERLRIPKSRTIKLLYAHIVSRMDDLSVKRKDRRGEEIAMHRSPAASGERRYHFQDTMDSCGLGSRILVGSKRGRRVDDEV